PRAVLGCVSAVADGSDRGGRRLRTSRLKLLDQGLLFLELLLQCLQLRKVVLGRWLLLRHGSQALTEFSELLIALRHHLLQAIVAHAQHFQLGQAMRMAALMLLLKILQEAPDLLALVL